MSRYDEQDNIDIDIEDLDNEPVEEEFEDEFFKEESKKGFFIRMIIILAIFFVGILTIVILLLVKKGAKTENNDLQNSIIDYAKEETALPTDVPAKETPAVSQADATPLPTLGIDVTSLQESEGDDDNAFAVHGEIMETGSKDYTKVKFDTKSNLKEMESYFDVNNNEAISDLAHLDRFIAMSYSLNFSDDDCYYYGDVNSKGQPDGKGIAVYADNQYYCGYWKNGKRDGAGKWVHFHIHNSDNSKDKIVYHEYQGNFSNDLPNGEGQDHYEYKLELLSKNKNYITNYMCNYKDGLIDGDVYCTSTDSEGTYLDWVGEAQNGSFVYISESRDNLKRGPVMTDRENPDNYMWIAEKDNKDIGVISYYSSYKK